MKKLKYMFWFILFGFLVLLVNQNFVFFSNEHSLHLNLGFYKGSTPELATGAIIAAFVIISVLIMMMFYLSIRYDGYRAKKMIKSLRASLEAGDDQIAKLNQELEMLKSGGDSLPVSEISKIDDKVRDGSADGAEAEITPVTQR